MNVLNPNMVTPASVMYLRDLPLSERLAEAKSIWKDRFLHLSPVALSFLVQTEDIFTPADANQVKEYILTGQARALGSVINKYCDPELFYETIEEKGQRVIDWVNQVRKNEIDFIVGE